MLKKLALASVCFLFAIAFFGITSQAEATNSPGCEITYTQNLQLGSSGVQVSALQNFLVAKGFLSMPAGATTGYFGGLTKAALARYQASVGVLSSGYFGPLTRAKVVADCGTGTVTTGTFSIVSPNSGTYAKGSQFAFTYNVTQSSSLVLPVLSLELENIYYPEQSIILSSNLPTTTSNGSTLTQNITIPTNTPAGTYRLVLCSGCLDNTPAGSVKEVRSSGYISISNSTVSTPTLTITSPTASNIYTQGSTMTIRWTNSTVLSSWINITLHKRSDPTYSYRIGVLGQTNDGVETFTIPTSITPGTDYYVRVNLDVTNPQTGMDVTQESPNFTISSAVAKTLSVNLNTSTITKYQNANYDLAFNWSSSYAIERLWAQVLDASGNIVTAKGGQNPGGSRGDNWYITIGTLPNGTYRLKLCELTEPEANRVCAPLQSFTVTNTTTGTTNPTVTVTSPNGGATYKIGDTLTATWSTANIPTTAFVRVSLVGPVMHKIIGANLSSAGNSSTFTIPAMAFFVDAGQTLVPGSYKVRVEIFSAAPCEGVFSNCPTQAPFALAQDESDTSFTIAAATTGTTGEYNPSGPRIVLSSMYPTTGPAGTNVTLRGEWITATGNVVRFGNLVSNVTPGFNVNAQIYPKTMPLLTFTIPSSVAPGTHKVSFRNGGGYYSNEVDFTVPYNFKLNSLNAGGNIAKGSTQNLQITIPSDKVYSVSYHLIPQGITTRLAPGNGSYFDPTTGGYALGATTPALASGTVTASVTIPSDIPLGTYKVRAYLRNAGDTAGSPTAATTLANDESDMVFGITN